MVDDDALDEPSEVEAQLLSLQVVVGHDDGYGLHAPRVGVVLAPRAHVDTPEVVVGLQRDVASPLPGGGRAHGAHEGGCLVVGKGVEDDVLGGLVGEQGRGAGAVGGEVGHDEVADACRGAERPTVVEVVDGADACYRPAADEGIDVGAVKAHKVALVPAQQAGGLGLPRVADALVDGARVVGVLLRQELEVGQLKGEGGGRKSPRQHGLG